VDPDGNGAEAAVTLTIIENGVQIAASDIVIVRDINEELGRPEVSIDGNLASGASSDLPFG
jgi:hypothetical protein